jgi:hypothetical protein
MTEIPKGFLLYSTISKAEIDSLLNEADPATREESLETLMANPYEAPLNTLYKTFTFNNLSFCMAENYSSDKTSCFLEIFSYLFTRSMISRLTENESFLVFQSLLLKHSVQRSPYSIAVFTCSEVKSITDYALITFFRHYSLYEYSFIPNSNLYLKNITRFEGVFPGVLKLEEGGEISAESIPALEAFIIKPVLEEPPRELGSDEEEALITDPLQYLLDKEMKQIRQELEEKFKKQDDEFISKIEMFKK